MKPISMLKWITALLILAVNTHALYAQTRADVFDERIPITWLGLDFSQAKFIGTAVMFSGDAPMTSTQFRDVMTLSWNNLFITEQKKYDVAKAVHRPSVKYAMDVAEQANSKLNREFFSLKPDDFKTIDEKTIEEQVKNYDFKNNDGIGLIFFVEGMNKALDQSGIWVTFVDMKSKTVLFTTYQTASPGGFGFRNYWSKPFYTTLKNINQNYNDWKKQSSYIQPK